MESWLELCNKWLASPTPLSQPLVSSADPGRIHSSNKLDQWSLIYVD